MSVDLISDQFFETVNDCRRIYVDQAVEATLSSSTLSADRQSEFLDEIELRFNRLVIKIFSEVAWSDLVWSRRFDRLLRWLHRARLVFLAEQAEVLRIDAVAI